ncbi:hypothetical protein [Pseudactinotalea suaedae]|uniref:hypothetical protein n=1 Tax=Pseudactinotalea suaedae TaxID=1524924 RepID=UPI0012E17808|nr:hypothetical protein [Pseudactinotalea suaedae]
MASIGLVAAVVWQVGGFSTDPNPPATPTQTTVTDEPTTGPSDPTEQPTETPTNSESETPTGDATDGSEPSTPPETETETPPMAWSPDQLPVCGEPFALPDADLALTVETGPDGPVAPGGVFQSAVENPTATAVSGSAASPFAVVVNDGVVVATQTNFVLQGGEGTPILALSSGGESQLPVVIPPGCDGGELSPGRYETFVLVALGSANTDGSVMMGAGGPWALDIADDGSDGQDWSRTLPVGGVPFPDVCGDSWDLGEPSTGMELELVHDVRSPRSASDDIEGDVRITTTKAMTDVVLYTHILILQDGVQVSAPVPANDNVMRVFMSPSASLTARIYSGLTGCDGALLPAGEYEAAVLLLGSDGTTPQVVARSELMPLVIE